MKLSQVKQANPKWFTRGNKRFFHDVGYRMLHGKCSRKPFLVRSTYAWTDMFGNPARLHFRVNPITEQAEIGSLLEPEFRSLDDVKDFLKTQ